MKGHDGNGSSTVSQRRRTKANGVLGSKKGRESSRTHGDARTDEIIPAVRRERLTRRGPPVEGSYLLISVVDCFLVSGTAIPPGVPLHPICCLDFFIYPRPPISFFSSVFVLVWYAVLFDFFPLLHFLQWVFQFQFSFFFSTSIM